MTHSFLFAFLLSTSVPALRFFLSPLFFFLLLPSAFSFIFQRIPLTTTYPTPITTMASSNPTDKSSIHSLPIPGADADIERATASASPPPTGRQIHGFQWFLVVVAVLSSMFMYSLDGTIVADLVPSIANEFQAVPLLPWLSVGFMVGSIVTVLPLGKLYGKYNAKHLYLISVVIFLAASALCGAAPNMSAMIVGRVLLGMAGNGVYFGILTLLSVRTDDTERPMYLSLVGLIWGVGTVLGPVVGGGFDKVNWRWAFYLNLSESSPLILIRAMTSNPPQ